MNMPPRYKVVKVKEIKNENKRGEKITGIRNTIRAMREADTRGKLGWVVFNEELAEVRLKLMSNLQNLRKKQNFSQSELAKKSNVNVRMIQYYEQGAKDINNAQAITVYKIAKALNCRVEDLLNLENED